MAQLRPLASTRVAAVQTQAQPAAAQRTRSWVSLHLWQHVAAASRPRSAPLELRRPSAPSSTPPLSRVPCHACLVNDLSLKSHRAFQHAFRSMQSKLIFLPPNCRKTQRRSAPSVPSTSGSSRVAEEDACPTGIQLEMAPEGKGKVQDECGRPFSSWTKARIGSSFWPTVAVRLCSRADSTTVELLAFLSTSCAVIPCTRGLLTSFRLC